MDAEERKLYLREYNAKNRERLKQQKREYYERNKEHLDETHARARQARLDAMTPDELIAYNEKRKAIQRRSYHKNKEANQSTSKATEWRKKNKDKYKAWEAQYKAKNKEALRLQRKAYRLNNPEKIKARENKMVFAPGQTVAGMLLEQHGMCAICGRPLAVDSKNTHADHDHTTGRVRGLLCNQCNVLLGQAEDNIARLHAAIEYLRKHSEKSESDSNLTTPESC